jgi:two-component system NarL family response regulator
MDTRRLIRVFVAHAEPIVELGLLAALQGRPGFLLVDPAADDSAPLVDVMVCDYETGIETVSRHRESRHLDVSPSVLIVSHIDTEGDVRRALDAGVQGYVLLGASLDELAASVREISDGARYVSNEVARRIVDSVVGSSLTHRELEVVSLVSLGASNKLIAARLGITVGTVKAHMRSVLDKLGAANRMEAAAVAARRGLLPGHASRYCASALAHPEPASAHEPVGH